jgi:ubiquinone/menaquinone biosynthesis C-methylase UbiE
MSFYESISDHYRKIFPLNREQLRFVISKFPGARQLTLLDIGCGTGDLSLELSKHFYRVVGIDLDETMLEQALKESEGKENIRFYNVDMLELRQKFGLLAFDTLLCFGNTLAHLQSMEEIASFLKQCSEVIRKGGKLLIQLINYDRILDLNITSLPTLETDEIRFIRNYHYRKDPHLIEFETILTVKSTNQIMQNSIQLLPIRKSELESLLLKTGFGNIHYYGNFKGESLGAESIPLVIETVYHTPG